MKTLINLLDAAGKTIERVAVSKAGYLSIVFTDGTFGLLSPTIGWDDEPGVRIHDEPIDYTTLYYIGDVVELGLISVEEWAAMTAEYNRDLDKKNEDHERAEYARLKAKFEPAVKATPFGVIGL